MTHYSEDNGTSARAEAEDETNAIALPFPKLNGGAAAFGADANAFGEENGTLTLQVDENDPSVGLAALQLASSDFEGLPQQQQTLIGGGDLATADLSWSAQMDAAGAAGAAGAGAGGQFVEVLGGAGGGAGVDTASALLEHVIGGAGAPEEGALLSAGTSQTGSE
eukprot:CAMPEP_0177732104 /NCGR_PEP_ID=MMETSP0484_2-20121128/22924_1 /TAXON_ID=354590 /ORGANISM="Rhodomonas lens, Strain RHODO" /LENGTH=164 /DNA_ID=CAMNT_0019245297 /DNA_START=571 /DNA_END=1062 /DNA_ORIENTATION=-